ncbi:MAG TPA: hypothetical protein VGQ65_21670 [Thermoanaerobaculia bacterium]|jgi:hypothetical protein|nr:hypothetical protein [Thermoanaerobaculia bacterium]
MTAVSVPATYAEWVPLLQRFRDGDDSVLELLLAGTIAWTNVVAERWTARVAEAFDARLKTVASRLQLALDRSRGDAFSVSQALLGARRALAPLHAAAAMSCAPESVREHFAAEVRRFAVGTQESLEASATRNRADVLLKALRDNPLTVVVPVLLSRETDSVTVTAAQAGPGRRILL